MAGLSGATGVSGFASAFAIDFLTKLLRQSVTSLRSAQFELLSPNRNTAFERVLNGLRVQRSTAEAVSAGSAVNQSRLGSLSTALTNVSTSLTSIQSLVQDTISTPTNATINQAAIDNLLAEINSEITIQRRLVDDPTFNFTNANTNLSNLTILTADGDLVDNNGFTVDLNVTTAATRAQITDYITGLNVANVSAVSFNLTGPLGTQLITITAGADQAAAIAIINAETENTGIEAIAGGAGDRVTLRAEDYGSGVSLTTLVVSDPGGEAALAADQTVTGIDAIATISVESGQVQSLTADGRDFTYNVDGVQGGFRVAGDVTFNPAAITVKGGNFLPLLDNLGFVISRINVNSLDYGYLGRSENGGGLAAIDVTTDADGALDIINQAIEDLDTDLNFVTSISSNIVDAQIDALDETISSLDEETTSINDLQAALRSFTDIQAEARLNSSLLLLSQLSSLFPVTTVGLL